VIAGEDQESWPWYVQQASYRDQLKLLWQYEPWVCTWRVGADVLLRAAPAVPAILGAVASAYIVDLSRPATVFLGACIAIALDRLGTGWRVKHGVRLLVPRRLWAWEHAVVGGETEVPLLINDADADRASRLLRAAHLSPGGWVRVPAPPQDAPWGNTRMVVRLPIASKNTEPLAEQVKRALGVPGIRGRVSGDDFPTATASTNSQHGSTGTS
jgi:hypothetical protein